MNASDSLTRSQDPDAGPDIAPLQLPLESADGAELEIEAEDEAHRRRLTLVDQEFSAIEPIA